MKKSLVVFMTLASLVYVGSVFSAESTAARETSKAAYNGITYFSPDPAYECSDAAVAEKISEAKPFNGITSFDVVKPGSGAKGSCAGGTPRAGSTDKPFNGITVF